MFGRLLAIWYLCEAPNQHVVLTIYVVNSVVSSTFKWKLYKKKNEYKLKRK